MVDCLFCKMAQGKMQVDKLYEDDIVFSIRDIHQRAPSHVMVIPQQHIPTATELPDDDCPLLVRLVASGAQRVRQEGPDGRGRNRGRGPQGATANLQVCPPTAPGRYLGNRLQEALRGRRLIVVQGPVTRRPE